MVKVLDHTSHEAYRFKTIDTVDGALDEVSQLGEEFAQFVQQKAFECSLEMSQGLNAPTKEPLKDYPAFRKSIFEDTKYIPALANTHLCYEYDAQFKEMNKHWSRAGKKFSDEPRLGKPPFSANNGPKKPEEFPHFNEREVKVFGKERQILPFSTSKKYTAPHDRCTIPYKPTPDEAASHLGPGAYPVADPWKARSGDGNIVGTVAFISEAKSRGDTLSDEYNLFKEEPTMIPHKASARQAHQALTGSPTRAKTPQDFSRAVIDRALAEQALPAGNRSAMSSSSSSRRPQTTSGVFRGTNYGPDLRSSVADQNTSSLSPPLQENAVSNAVSEVEHGLGTSSSRVTTNTANKRPPAGTRAQLKDLQVMTTSLHSDPSFYKYLTESRINNVKPGTSPIKYKGSRGILSRMPGMSFGNGKLGKSAVDISTGSTGADKKFRRLQLPSGETLIYETNKDSNASNMPRGARFTSNWDQTGVFAEKDPSIRVAAQPMVLDEHPVTRLRNSPNSSPAPSPSGSRNGTPHGKTKVDKKNVALPLPGPTGVIARNGPIYVTRTRPASANVAVALPAPLSSPKVYPGYREWRPPMPIERKHLSLSANCTPAGIPMVDMPTFSPPPKLIQSMINDFHEEHARMPNVNTFTRKISEPVFGQDPLGMATAKGNGPALSNYSAAFDFNNSSISS